MHVYKDGSVLINHGGTEMGQGLHTKMIQVAATALGVPLSYVRLAPTRTDKVPNTSATAASSGADLNGGAVKDACDQIRARLNVVAAGKLGIHPDDVRFVDGMVTGIGFHDKQLDWKKLVHDAYFMRVQLWAAGFYRTAGLHWDADRMQGEPFKYFAYGASVSEVEVDGFTGAYRLRRVDIVHDVGDSLSPLIDLGQIEGGFVQGAGWLTLEELTLGRERRPAPRPAEHPGGEHLQDPELLRDARGLQRAPVRARRPSPGVVYGSKAVGEPPLMHAFSVREALRQAVGAFGPAGPQRRPGQPGHAGGRLLGGRGGPGGRCRARRAARVRIAGSGSDLDWLEALQQLRREGAARRAGDRGRGARSRTARSRAPRCWSAPTSPGGVSAAATSRRRPCAGPGR